MQKQAAESQPALTGIPPWSDIDTVMFDMDGTLLDLHFDNYFWQTYVPQVWGARTGVGFETASARLEARYAELRGTLNWYCLDFWAAELDLDVVALKHEVRHKIAVRPNVTGLLNKLRKTGKRLLLITNAHPDSLALKLKQTGIGEYFDRMVSSHTLQLAKENHGFWTALLALEHYDPQRTLLIDDSLPVLRQARHEGIRHLYGVYQPDSQQDPKIHEEFPLIIDFEHILPPHPGPAPQRETD